MHHDATRASWNRATANHNRHKGDQAARLRAGWDPLFPEELDLLGPLDGRDLVHLQCNAGQDTLALARRGARATGVDLSDTAIAFARQLSADSGLPATFVHAEVCDWLHATDARFDLAVSTYGTLGWLADLARYFHGVARVLRPGGAFVWVDFHPACWSYGDDLALTGDDYFTADAFWEPVSDYVAASGPALGAVSPGDPGPNDLPAPSWQHTLADVVQALLDAGLALDTLREWPHSNGCRLSPGLVALDERRWGWPEGKARLPLMVGVRARRA